MSKGKENKDSTATKAIFDYLVQQNRPYSATDIFNNLHKEHGKTLVEKTLDTLVDQGKIKAKAYGKQKVFVADQNKLPDVDESEIKSMDKKINDFSEKLKVEQESTKKLESEVHVLQNSVTTDDAKKEVTQLSTDCNKLSERLESLKTNKNAVAPQEREKIMKAREKMVKEWRKRKRMANEMLNTILEGYPKSKKELFEEIGIETDEDLKVRMPDI